MRDSPVIRRLVIAVTTPGYSKIETASRDPTEARPDGDQEGYERRKVCAGSRRGGSGPNWAPLRSFARAGDPNPRVRSVSGRGFGGEDLAAVSTEDRDEVRRGVERRRGGDGRSRESKSVGKKRAFLCVSRR